MTKIDEFLKKLAGENTNTTAAADPAKEQEALMAKFANQNETIECSTTLALAAEALTKLAEESKDEVIAECAEGLTIASQRYPRRIGSLAVSWLASSLSWLTGR